MRHPVYYDPNNKRLYYLDAVSPSLCVMEVSLADMPLLPSFATSTAFPSRVETLREWAAYCAKITNPPSSASPSTVSDNEARIQMLADSLAAVTARQNEVLMTLANHRAEIDARELHALTMLKTQLEKVRSIADLDLLLTEISTEIETRKPSNDKDTPKIAESKKSTSTTPGAFTPSAISLPTGFNGGLIRVTSP